MNNTFENGRSMVEMLGVLAVIGVLSIGGVAGYSYAMDKSRANRTLNDICLRAVTLQTQHATGRGLDLSEYAGMNTTYNIIKAELSDGGYGLIVENVPQRVCQMIYEGLNSWADAVKIGETVMSSSDACATTNTMTIAFNHDAQTGGTTEGDTNDDQDKTNCPDGYYPIENRCFKCPDINSSDWRDYGASCGPDGIKCKENSIFYSGACWNKKDGCSALDEHGYCTDDGKIQCDEGYYLYWSSCVMQCPSGSTVIGGACACSNGNIGDFGWIYDGGTYKCPEQ